MESVVSSLIGSCCGKDCHEWNTERGSRQTYVAGGGPIIPYHSALDDTRDSLLARLRSRGNERHKAQQHGQLHLTRYTTFGLVAGLDETINTFVRPKVLDPNPVGFTFVAVNGVSVNYRGGGGLGGHLSRTALSNPTAQAQRWRTANHRS